MFAVDDATCCDVEASEGESGNEGETFILSKPKQVDVRSPNRCAVNGVYCGGGSWRELSF